jgi:histidinol-phosphate phosphatase family protein
MSDCQSNILAKEAVFLDRDGVVNKKARSPGYIKDWHEFIFLSGVSDAIRRLNEEGFVVVIVSNQRAVAKGIISERTLKDMHAKMISQLCRNGAKIDAIYYCPHDIEDNCQCRKPKPGMLIEAARALSLDLGKSWMIGDKKTDIEAGKKAGCSTILLVRRQQYSYKTGADMVAVSLPKAVEKIIKIKRNAVPQPC